eukprot:TRINITY_DN17212_c0_g1_i2.p1 TRINITY_DN17212_c0_g1~~TRINITY_DN17212_c0_g1_i2.p1  ORF type:complete len:1744 (+),score=378.04 TRINITY_DN17212_c0_g1_i2:72-5303(+)
MSSPLALRPERRAGSLLPPPTPPQRVPTPDGQLLPAVGRARSAWSCQQGVRVEERICSVAKRPRHDSVTQLDARRLLCESAGMEGLMRVAGTAARAQRATQRRMQQLLGAAAPGGMLPPLAPGRPPPAPDPGSGLRLPVTLPAAAPPARRPRKCPPAAEAADAAASVRPDPRAAPALPAAAPLSELCPLPPAEPAAAAALGVPADTEAASGDALFSAVRESAGKCIGSHFGSNGSCRGGDLERALAKLALLHQLQSAAARGRDDPLPPRTPLAPAEQSPDSPARGGDVRPRPPRGSRAAAGMLQAARAAVGAVTRTTRAAAKFAAVRRRKQKQALQREVPLDVWRLHPGGRRRRWQTRLKYAVDEYHTVGDLVRSASPELGVPPGRLLCIMLKGADDATENNEASNPRLAEHALTLASAGVREGVELAIFDVGVFLPVVAGALAALPARASALHGRAAFVAMRALVILAAASSILMIRHTREQTWALTVCALAAGAVVEDVQLSHLDRAQREQSAAALVCGAIAAAAIEVVDAWEQPEESDAAAETPTLQTEATAVVLDTPRARSRRSVSNFTEPPSGNSRVSPSRGERSASQPSSPAGRRSVPGSRVDSEHPERHQTAATAATAATESAPAAQGAAAAAGAEKREPGRPRRATLQVVPAAEGAAAAAAAGPSAGPPPLQQPLTDGAQAEAACAVGEPGSEAPQPVGQPSRIRRPSRPVLTLKPTESAPESAPPAQKGKGSPSASLDASKQLGSSNLSAGSPSKRRGKRKAGKGGSDPADPPSPTGSAALSAPSSPAGALSASSPLSRAPSSVGKKQRAAAAPKGKSIVGRDRSGSTLPPPDASKSAKDEWASSELETAPEPSFSMSANTSYQSWLRARKQGSIHAIIVCVEQYPPATRVPRLYHGVSDGEQLSAVLTAQGISVDLLTDTAQQPWLRSTRENAMHTQWVAQQAQAPEDTLLVFWQCRGALRRPEGERPAHMLYCADSPAGAEDEAEPAHVTLDSLVWQAQRTLGTVLLYVDCWAAASGAPGFAALNVCAGWHTVPRPEHKAGKKRKKESPEVPPLPDIPCILYHPKHQGGLLMYYFTKVMDTVTGLSDQDLTALQLARYCARRMAECKAEVPDCLLEQQEKGDHAHAHHARNSVDDGDGGSDGPPAPDPTETLILRQAGPAKRLGLGADQPAWFHVQAVLSTAATEMGLDGLREEIRPTLNTRVYRFRARRPVRRASLHRTGLIISAGPPTSPPTGTEKFRPTSPQGQAAAQGTRVAPQDTGGAGRGKVFDPSKLPRCYIVSNNPAKGPIAAAEHNLRDLLVRGSERDVRKFDKMRRCGALSHLMDIRVILRSAQPVQMHLAANRIQAKFRGVLAYRKCDGQRRVLKEWYHGRTDVEEQYLRACDQITVQLQANSLFLLRGFENSRRIEVQRWHLDGLRQVRVMRRNDYRVLEELGRWRMGELEKYSRFFVEEGGACVRLLTMEARSRHVVRLLWNVHRKETYYRYQVECNEYAGRLQMRNTARAVTGLRVAAEQPPRPVRPMQLDSDARETAFVAVSLDDAWNKEVPMPEMRRVSDLPMMHADTLEDDVLGVAGISVAGSSPRAFDPHATFGRSANMFTLVARAGPSDGQPPQASLVLTAGAVPAKVPRQLRRVASSTVKHLTTGVIGAKQNPLPIQAVSPPAGGPMRGNWAAQTFPSVAYPSNFSMSVTSPRSGARSNENHDRYYRTLQACERSAGLGPADEEEESADEGY